MHSSQIGSFFAKCALLSSPFVFLVATYLYYDPAQVLRHYTDFNQGEMVNRDFISTQTFLNNNPTQHYQSFILGNSRSGPYYTTDWAPYIHDKQPFHFDAAAESLYGVYSKVKFLDTHADKLKNVLIICDRGLLKNTSNPAGGPLFMKDSRASDNSWLEFQLGFIKAYFSDFFYVNFLKRKLSGEKKDPNKLPDSYYYVPVSNDMPLKALDAQIAQDSVGYYKSRADLFKNAPKPAAIEAQPVIKEEQLKMLQEMARIFKKHNTDYRIVISPLYDKLPLNPQDERALRAVFGENRVYNYSGSNKFTNSCYNYYETSHYRPHVARQIMKEIYSNPVE
ncbi:hypothetical protein [Hymenobacter sp. BT730]|uniref:hypothetical protein n=1 Tax=Hymenobacter sp. BT730 TaxID=3063332 RepID=UPI0026DEC83B|nr:hypothetical protein [Hymenobacter sp. BT730]